MNEGRGNTLHIETGTFFRGMLVILLFVFLYLLRELIAVILFSVVVASGIDPAAKWFERRRLPRAIAVILIYLIIFSVLGVAFYTIIPSTFSDLSEATVLIPDYLDKTFGEQIENGLVPGIPRSLSTILLGLAEYVRDFVGKFTGGFFHAAAIAFGGAISFLLVIIISFYLSVQEKGIENFLRIVTPIRHEKYILSLWVRSQKKISIWVKGQILLGLLVGVLTYLGLTILQVNYALTLAIFAAILELIPIFGPVISSIPAIGVAFLQSPILALYVVILYVVVQQFESHLIYPLVVRKIIGVPPILVIISLIAGVQLGGFFGILLAVPAITVFMEFLNDFEAKKEGRRVKEEE
ncbi:MAG TPA: AI-2E family transporter [Candidatus Paceibacterota bacterium]